MVRTFEQNPEITSNIKHAYEYIIEDIALGWFKNPQIYVVAVEISLDLSRKLSITCQFTSRMIACIALAVSVQLFDFKVKI